MKKPLIGIIIIAIVAVIGWYIVQKNQEDSRKPSIANAPPVTERPKTAEAAEPVEEEDSKLTEQSAYYKKPDQENIPPNWEDFYEISEVGKMNRVIREMRSSKPVTPEVYAFFKAEIFNRSHLDTTRNNMANRLVWARNEKGLHPDPDLHKAFITMLEDETEDPVWRDYCIQFLSLHLPNSSDPGLVKQVITRYSKISDRKSGTAIIHMSRQERKGNMQLDESFDKQLVEQLENPEVHRDTKMAILSVMGQRKETGHLPLIRKYATQDENASLKRAAIAVLGTIGASEETASHITDADKALIKSALNHRNRAVVLAAQGALKRLGSQ